MALALALASIIATACHAPPTETQHDSGPLAAPDAGSPDPGCHAPDDPGAIVFEEVTDPTGLPDDAVTDGAGHAPGNAFLQPHFQHVGADEPADYPRDKEPRNDGCDQAPEDHAVYRSRVLGDWEG